MGTRRLFLGLVGVGVLVVIGLLVSGVFRERELEYGGKRLSEWVWKLGEPTAGGMLRRAGRDGPAWNALLQIGSNAIPYLVRWIQYEPPTWKRNLYALINHNLKCDIIDKKEALMLGAVDGFEILGPNAEGAIPELALLMNDPKAPSGAGRATDILSHFLH